MSDTQDAKSDPTSPANQTPEPTRLERNLLYAFGWIPPLAFLAYVMPMFSPIFEKLFEKGQMPAYSLWVWRLASFNEEFYFLPVVFVFVMMRALAEYFIIVSRGLKDREICIAVWRFGIICVGLLLWIVCGTAPLVPVFKMSKVAVEPPNPPPRAQDS